MNLVRWSLLNIMDFLGPSLGIFVQELINRHCSNNIFTPFRDFRSMAPLLDEMRLFNVVLFIFESIESLINILFVSFLTFRIYLRREGQWLLILSLDRLLKLLIFVVNPLQMLLLALQKVLDISCAFAPALVHLRMESAVSQYAILLLLFEPIELLNSFCLFFIVLMKEPLGVGFIDEASICEQLWYSGVKVIVVGLILRAQRRSTFIELIGNIFHVFLLIWV